MPSGAPTQSIPHPLTFRHTSRKVFTRIKIPSALQKWYRITIYARFEIRCSRKDEKLGKIIGRLIGERERKRETVETRRRDSTRDSTRLFRPNPLFRRNWITMGEERGRELIPLTTWKVSTRFQGQPFAAARSFEEWTEFFSRDTEGVQCESFVKIFPSPSSPLPTVTEIIAHSGPHFRFITANERPP